MKIGVMLRDIGNQRDAPGIIVLNLMDKILELDRENDYVLFYRNRAFLDRYDSYNNVKSVLVGAPTKVLWDQFAVPWTAQRENVELIFHPKFSLPLLSRCKTLMCLRGSEYWVRPEYYGASDLINSRVMLPRFCQKATHLIVESEYVKKDFHEFLAMPLEKMTTIHLAPNERFKVITDDGVLESIRHKYNLPSEFLLTVTRILQGKRYYPGKNLINSIEAYQTSEARNRLKFLIVGRQTERFIDKLSIIQQEMRKNIIALDFVPQEDLPAIYNLASLFLFPSTYESFGIPLTEAMACGSPVIASKSGACPEVVGNAGLLVDPQNISQIAKAIDLLTFDPSLRDSLRQRGLEEVKRFSWSKAARQTLDVIRNLE